MSIFRLVADFDLDAEMVFYIDAASEAAAFEIADVALADDDVVAYVSMERVDARPVWCLDLAA